ncbi:MarR family winged helix-turn-helix transcriptional regulator [Actinotalea sp. Marseille-Q4924]|uniref:MarR family winged helix-turn-helix transcriptional regulator n=1 Tax=Actinotalea sp. Marseille-Q4924 TaxID=2866571 RepID=UPI001CE47F0E|nr:MarR family winged helix-turn-helix transcriptional regulator [Actinotalea sp. Marseille-Q4924]
MQRSDLTDALDDALVAVQRVPRRSGYRMRLLGSVAIPGGLGTFRALRAVERGSTAGAPSVGDVAEALVVDPSTASRVVERCVDAGLLSRTPDAEDRRRSALALTAAGSAVLAQVTRNRRAALAEVVDGWSDDDVARLVALLGELLQGMDRLESPP